MKKFELFFLLPVMTMLFLGSAFAEEKKVKIAGSGGMIPLVTELAKAYMAANQGTVVEVEQKSIQSTGGIRSTFEGKIDIGMANRSFKSEEKSLGLQAVEIARVGVVVGVNKVVRVKDISSENLCKIYGGQIASWKDVGGDGQIVVLTKSESDATKETVRKSVSCFKNLKETDRAVLIPTTPETTKVLANRPNTIGFTDMVNIEEAKGAITPLRLDGVAATPETVRNGKYKMVQSFSLITKGKPSGTVKDFIDFVKGPKGAKIIEANKAVAVK